MTTETLIKIPGDTGGDWRAKKFVEYANFVPPVHQSFLIEYAKLRNLTEEQCVLLSFLMGHFYSELTAVFVLEYWNYTLPDKTEIRNFIEKYNDTIIYGTARKWMKYNDRTYRILSWLSDETSETGILSWFKSIAVGSNEREVYDNIKSYSLRCPEYGRFASDLFNEILMIYSKSNNITVKLKSDESINFREGNNLTAGLFNIVYMDERANQWDKHEYITDAEFDFLMEKLLWVKSIYEQRFPEKEIDVPLFVTKICSFRNCFKGRRGGGYHHYRQLKYLIYYEKTLPECKSLWDDCYLIRKRVYPDILRGEDYGITDIPPELTKWWLKYGWIGNEPEALASIRKQTIDNFL